MGYTIRIGNAVPRFAKEDGCLSAWWHVEGEKHPDAPTFPNDDMTGNGNGRHPSYSGWKMFCEEAGLVSLFYGNGPHARGGLLEEHPGCVLLKPEHLAAVQVALKLRQASSDKPPGFGGEVLHDESGRVVVRNGFAVCQDADKYDPILARLIWLEWWMRWALANCETPAVYNS